jgi:hypothetical protein
MVVHDKMFNVVSYVIVSEGIPSEHFGIFPSLEHQFLDNYTAFEFM